jgi:transcriptional regulator with XRE-family HTH domain
MLDEPNTFGDVLRYERELAGYGVRQLAKKIGVSATYLSRIETGHIAPPTEARIQKIAEILDTNFYILMGAAGRVPSDIASHFSHAPTQIMRLLELTSGMSRSEIDALNGMLEGIVAQLNAVKGPLK